MNNSLIFKKIQEARKKFDSGVQNKTQRIKRAEKHQYKKAPHLIFMKQSLNDLNKLAGLHAWNKVTCDGKEYLIDVTWSDNGMYLDMKWMFVQPSIMIGSHIPYDKEDQLLEKPITNEVFMNTACMIPLKENVKLANDYFSAKYFVPFKFIY